MKVSGQLHPLPTSPPEKEPPVPIVYEAGWAPEPVTTLWRREKSLPYRDWWRIFSESKDILLISIDFGLKITVYCLQVTITQTACFMISPFIFQLIQSQALKVIHHDPAISIRLHLLIIYKTYDSDVLSYVNGRALCDHYKGTVRLPQLKLQLHDSGWCVPGTRATTCIPSWGRGCVTMKFVARTMARCNSKICNVRTCWRTEALF
jgi:hypothetical protein